MHAHLSLHYRLGNAVLFDGCRYLSFVQGIVDSDTLPLQVSRESLQQHAALKTIKKKLVRKTLDMIRKLADAETSFEAEDADSTLQFPVGFLLRSVLPIRPRFGSFCT